MYPDSDWPQLRACHSSIEKGPERFSQNVFGEDLWYS